MQETNKIVTNKLLASLMWPSISKLMLKLYGNAPIAITNDEIETAMLGIKCECKARLEALPDCDEEYKHQQEQNLENVVYWLEEMLKQANTYEQEMGTKMV